MSYWKQERKILVNFVMLFDLIIPWKLQVCRKESTNLQTEMPCLQDDKEKLFCSPLLGSSSSPSAVPCHLASLLNLVTYQTLVSADSGS